MEDKSQNKTWILISKSLSGEASENELQELNNWMQENHVNESFFKKLNNIQNEEEKIRQISNIDLDKALHKVKSIDNKGKVLKLKTIVKIAATIIILTGTVLFSKQVFFNKDYIVVETGPDKRITQTLADGSKITLNQNSKLIYDEDYGLSNRDVELSGEAYFEVTKNKKLPFIIDVSNAEVKVVGTSFNVKTDVSNIVDVMVNEGKVKLTSKISFKSNSILVEAGNTAILDFNSNNLILIKEVDENKLAWKTKRMRFKNKPLEDVVKTLEEVYDVNFIIENGLEDKKLNALFVDQPLESVIEIISTSIQVNIRKTKNKTYSISLN